MSDVVTPGLPGIRPGRAGGGDKRPAGFRFDLLTGGLDLARDAHRQGAARLCVSESVVDLSSCTAMFGPFGPGLIRTCIGRTPMSPRHCHTLSGIKLSGSLIHRHPTLPTQRRLGRAILIEQHGLVKFGTWLLDILPRIVAALDAAGDDGAPIDIVVPRRCMGIAERFGNLLAVLDSRLRILVVQDGEVLQIDEAIVPPSLRDDHRLSPGAAGFFERIQHAAVRCAPDAGSLGERVFLSRRHWKNQRRLLVNRARVEILMAEHGFVNIVPEQFEVAHLIAGLRSVVVLAGEQGSALHAGGYSPAAITLSLVGNTQSEDRSCLVTSAICAMRRSRSILVAGSIMPGPREARQAPFQVSETLIRRVVECL